MKTVTTTTVLDPVMAKPLDILPKLSGKEAPNSASEKPMEHVKMAIGSVHGSWQDTLPQEMSTGNIQTMSGESRTDVENVIPSKTSPWTLFTMGLLQKLLHTLEKTLVNTIIFKLHNIMKYLRVVKT